MSTSKECVEAIPLMSPDEDEIAILAMPQHAAKGFDVSRILAMILSHVKAMIVALVPSFLSPSYDSKFRLFEEGSTLWLDGLRGIAAFFVFIYHFVATYIPNMTYVWDPVRHPNLLFLPIFRVTYNGSAMVMIFFVVSGFALTCKPAKLMHQGGKRKTLLETMASSVLRRYLRLILPCFGAFVLIHTLRITGAMDWYSRQHSRAKSRFGEHPNKFPPKSADGILGQASIMMHDFWAFAIGKTIFDQKYDFTTDNHLWTIPVEYQESMKLFLLVVMISMIRRTFRIWVVLPWMFGFYFYHKKIETVLFITGYFLAELHAGLHLSLPLPTLLTPSPLSTRKLFQSLKARKVIWWGLVFIGLFLLSFPTTDGEKSFGFVTISKSFNKSYRYYDKRQAIHCIGAVCLCFALLHLPRAQRWLSFPLFQYLGRISFSLYLVHGVIIRSLAHRLILGAWNHFPKDASVERTSIVIIAFLFAVLPATICVADLFWRVVEGPSVEIVKWFERVVIVKED